MLCALTVRKLKPGAYEEFRRAWEPEQVPEGFTRAYHLRNLEDTDEVISFGFFDGTIDDLRRVQRDSDYAGQRARVDATVESTGTDAIFEVVEEVDLAAAAAG
jgi:heme-degrading monooxygenase HmoA